VLLAELGAQPADVDVDGAGTAVVLVPHTRLSSISRVKTLPGFWARNFSSSYSMYVMSSGRPAIAAW
jgi:hypothetical protein